jgi:hypothetical protein
MREDGTYYCCHRAACGESGIINKIGVAYTADERTTKPKPQTKQFDTPFRALQDGELWADRWYDAVGSMDYAPAKAGLFLSEADPMEAVWLCQGFNYELLGYQTRINWQVGGKRVRTFKETEGPRRRLCLPWLQR